MLTAVLERLQALLREQGGLIAAAVPDEPPAGSARHGALAATGDRARHHAAKYELLVEAIREGYLLHYAAGRVVRPEDPDLALLAGDQLYALGLARLAALGDVAAVAALADVISLTAQAHAAGDEQLAEAVWEAGVVEVGWGSNPELDRAKASARAGEPGAADALRACARTAAGNLPGAPGLPD